MKVFALSDIHGCLAPLEVALETILPYLEEDDDSMLVLCGDYIHGGDESRGVIDKIMQLENMYGDRICPILGNHDSWVLEGTSTLDSMYNDGCDRPDDEKYINFLSRLPLYICIGNAIFSHAGINEDLEDINDWELGTDEDIFLSKYPASVGVIPDFGSYIICGHIYTSEISGSPSYHDIYTDGQHYYLDGDVLTSGYIPILMYDTETDKFYRVTENGYYLILPYDEENN